MKYTNNLIFILFLLVSNVFGQFGQNKVSYKDFNWLYIQTKHFDIYFDEHGKEIAQFAAHTLEYALDQLSSELNYKINNRLAVIVYNTHNDFQETNAADEYLSQGIGGFTEPFKNRVVMPFDGDYASFRSTLHHELVHAVMNDLLYGGTVQNIISKNLTLQIPQWYSEGMAEYLSVKMETKTDQYMRNAAISESLPDITSMSGYTSYRAGESLFYYISQKYGEQKVGEILTKIKNNGGLEQGFKAALGLSLDELNENWHKYLKKMYWPEIAFRIDPDEFAKRLTGKDKSSLLGQYNASSVISPLGDKIAYISNRDIWLDIYILNTIDGEEIKKVAEIGRSMDFEEVNPLYPSIAWAPDNKRICISAKRGGYDVLYIIDTETEETNILPFHMGGIGEASWSPDGKKIAFVGNNTEQSDIYIYDIDEDKLINFTNDQFTEASITWYTNSEKIIFSSDRGNYLKGHPADKDFDIYYYDTGQMDLYLADIVSDDVIRINDWELSTESAPVVSPDGKYLFFISDKNGINNIYKKRIVFNYDDNTSKISDLPSVPITNSISSIQQISLSKDGLKMAFDTEYKSGNNIFIINNPLDIDLGVDELEPTDFMASKINTYQDNQVTESVASTIADLDVDNIVDESREAIDQIDEERNSDSVDSTKLNEEVVSTDSSQTDDFSFESLNSPEIFSGQYEDDSKSDKDTLLTDYSDYIFGGDDVTRTKEDEKDKKEDVFKENLDDDGNYLVNHYKTHFTPDLVYANAGYGTLYGLMGTTVLSFSDMLGNHRLIGVTSMQIDLKNSDYGLAYYNLEHRMNYSVQFFHTARFVYLSSGGYSELYRFRNLSSVVTFNYPFSRFNRFDFGLSVQSVSSENLDNTLVDTQNNTFIIPSVSYVYDNSFWGYYSPIEGTRYIVTAFGDPGITRSTQSFYSLLWDYRTYFRFWYDNSFVFRFSGGYSGGGNPQRFILGGTENWLNRTFRTGQIPLENPSDFAFLSPALPLRGYDYAQQIGTKYSLVNVELRMPLIRYLVTGPLPILLQNILGGAFLDVGTAWTENKQLKLFRKNDFGNTVTDNLLIGTGVGARLPFFFLWRFDVAWTYDLVKFSKPRYYISIGLDF